jgi:aminoglycoside phosphotransferase (APT) family kinase protein
MKQQIDVAALVDVPRLQAWLDAHVPELGSGALAVDLVHGGTSNVILSLQRDRASMVLRRPPAAAPPGSARAIEREARLLSALNATDVPHPHVWGSCTDAAVMGASFYVMERVDGWAPSLDVRVTRFNPPFDALPHKPALAFAMLDGLIKLANVDYLALGLGDFGKPDGFLQRQVDRWGSQLESYKTTYRNYQGRDIPGLAYVAAWLREHMPAAAAPAILHGDYGFPNVMFANAPPARLAAMIDWELATIGDPLLDLGWYLNAFRDARQPEAAPHSSYFDPRDFPTRQELAAHYAAGTGRDVADLDYYVVLALYKGACICEYKVAAAMDGLQSRAIGAMFERFVLDNASEAEKIARWNP